MTYKLTHHLLLELKKFSGSGYSREVKSSVVRNLLEKGQPLYKFNRDKSGLDKITFVCWFTSLEDYKSAIVSRGDSTHLNDHYVCTNLVRDILLSLCGDYDSECYFLEEDVAKRKLKKYNKEKLEKLLEE